MKEGHKHVDTGYKIPESTPKTIIQIGGEKEETKK
jgi:hypothetical protein